MAKANKKTALKAQMLIIFFGLMAAVFLPTSAILCIGMLPTFMVTVASAGKKMTKAVTIGGLNLAGCSPFLLELWSSDHSLDKALNIISQSKTIAIIYGAAAAGYAVDWTVTEVVSGLLYQRGNARKKAISDRQEELVRRWGREVTGEIPLDQYGFPLDPVADQKN